MKRIISLLTALVLAAALFSAERNLAQYSTINNLMAAKYDSRINIEYISADGDFGMGTFEGLDGEMIILDGKFYKAKYGGKVEEAKKSEIIPFAMLTTFKADKTAVIKDMPDLKSLQEALLKELDRKDEYAAIRISGELEYIKTRSIPAQKTPIPALSEVVKLQSVLESRNVKGTLVGFFTPEHDRKHGSPDFHFHFVNDERTEGGHVLEVKVRSAEAGIEAILIRSLQEDLAQEVPHTKIKPMGRALEQLLEQMRESTPEKK